MSTINLIIDLLHPSAISSNVRVARVDNTPSPVYTTYANVSANPFILNNVPNGQYFIGATPNYADGRVCAEVPYTTAPCTGINSFSAKIVSTNFVVSYSVAAGLPAVRINIQYPNGGSSSNIYTASGLDITIPIPTGVLGDYSLTITPCCDEDTGFFGSQSAPVILNVA